MANMFGMTAYEHPEANPRHGRRTIVRAGLLGLVAVVMLVAASAHAAPVPGTPAVITSPLGGEDAGSFVPPVLAITEGGSLTFVNFDTVSHNVVCVELDAQRRPLCRSDLVGVGGTAAVTGVDRLSPGSHDLYCQLHPQMTAALTVLDTP